MKYRIDQIRLDAREYTDKEDRQRIFRRKILHALRKVLRDEHRLDMMPSFDDIENVEILKESIDARKKPHVKAVFSLTFKSRADLPLKKADDEPSWDPGDLPGFSRNRPRPVIAGFGPCGIFASLVLAMAGARPIVLERGKPVEERLEDVSRFWKGGDPDPESNVQFGEGGAGTFSDGKLTTGIRDHRKAWILERLIEGGADPSIRYKNKPHIGTDRLRTIVPNIRKRIESLGGEIRFSTRLENIVTEEGRLRALKTVCGGKEDVIHTDCLILATGHSAEDTFGMLKEAGVSMRPKAFSIGVRVEHLQEDIDRAQYGDPTLAQVFGPAEYKLNHRCKNGRGVYTFCMCPGGQVINASSSPGYALTNGMSNHARDGSFANSGLLVDVRPEDFMDGDDPLAGVAFQKKYEAMAWKTGPRGRKDDDRDEDPAAGLPVSCYGNFRRDNQDPVRSCLPEFAALSIIEAMPHLGRKLKGFDNEKTRMRAVETRSSSPVKIERGEDLQSSIYGIIPAGEGPGYAGGIMSAAVDGIRAASAVLMMDEKRR